MIGPLRFAPVFKHYVWGGRRLEDLGKDLGGRERVAESWEIVDRGADQSAVLAGPHAGCTLGELMRSHGEALLGSAPRGPFPLLLKLLDARQPLSVQVHPSDDQAARLGEVDRGKTEAWVVLEAAPDAVLHVGLAAGVDRPALRRAVEQGRVADCLNALRPRPGDVLFIGPGTVHTLGAGFVVAELQNVSDLTYRVFDWDRPGDGGRPRPLHVDRALEVIDFARGPVTCEAPVPLAPGRERLVTCDAFELERWCLSRADEVGGPGRCSIVHVVEGAVVLQGDPAGRPLVRGGSALLPAAAGAVGISPLGEAIVLVAHPPRDR